MRDHAVISASWGLRVDLNDVTDGNLTPLIFAGGRYIRPLGGVVTVTDEDGFAYDAAVDSLTDDLVFVRLFWDSKRRSQRLELAPTSAGRATLQLTSV